jgi:hypothetical protein
VIETGRLYTDLRSPNPVGRDLALYRIRAYRFTDDHRHYVLAEQLEERYLDGIRLRPTTLTYVEHCLNAVRAGGRFPVFSNHVATSEGIDIAAELRAREPYGYRKVLIREPRQVIAIVGAPRSGTSHLYNLLAATGRFAYFTTVSCWAWPTRNLTRAGRRLFTDVDEDVLAVDNKGTRLLPGLVMPYEAEDVYARTIPTYRHIAGHHYDLTPARIATPEILSRATSAHLAYFNRDILLTKSPFNSLRINQLEKVWGGRLHYIHITRDPHDTAESIRRNHFEFEVGGHLLSAEGAQLYFTNSIRRDAPRSQTLVVNHRALLRNPEDVVRQVNVGCRPAGGQ